MIFIGVWLLRTEKNFVFFSKRLYKSHPLCYLNNKNYSYY